MLLPTLQLCHIWGEMIIMLAQYSSYRADSFAAQPHVHTSSDLSYVHSYLRAKDWMKIHKTICKSDDKRLLYLWVRRYELPRDKANKMACVPSKDSDQPGHPPSLIKVVTVHMKKPWALSYPLSTSKDSDKTGQIPRLI